MKKHSLLLGAHISIAGGIYKAFTRGEEIGCTAIQIFTKSNRRWFASPLKKEEIKEFQQTQQHSSVKSVSAHAAYLLNIASPKNEILEKSKHALIDELKRVELLGIPTLVLHPGSRQDMPLEESLKQVAQTCDEVFSQVPGSSKIALETMAGQGTSVGGSLEQLATIIKQVKNKARIGVCVDTCHIFASGYDIRNKQTYDAFWKIFDAIIGIHKLCIIHLNDSKKGLGTKVDRHQFISKGELGKEAFKLLMNDERFFDIPKILETPVDDQSEYVKDLKLLKSFLTPATKREYNL